MVLESILSPKSTEDKPWHIFFIAFFYSIIAIIFAHQLFSSQSSILSIALITIIFIPFFQKIFELEEDKEKIKEYEEKKKHNNLFKRHDKSIFVFSYFFLGVIVAMSFAFIFLPSFGEVFMLQSQWFQGNGLFPAGHVTTNLTFETFFLNNTQVMLLMFVLSILFGAGAIFILVWNASVIAVFLGLFTKSTAAGGIDLATAYLYGLPVGLGSIALHGIPEIGAYFLAGLAGGILSVGIIRERLGSGNFRHVLRDSLMFLIMAEVLIIVAAVIEVVV